MLKVNFYCFSKYQIDQIGHICYIEVDQSGQLSDEKGATIIYSKFKSLDEEKQERIINAAIKEFVKSGFDKASTNEIVREASISKGSLFNYFNNKKDLYSFLIENGVEVIEKIYEEVDFNETDMFKRLGDIGLVKLTIQKKFPQVFDFFIALMKEESEEVKEDIDQRIKSIYERGFEKLYENIDYTKFREDIDVQKAIKILTWTMLGFGEEARERLHSFVEVGPEHLKEWEGYSDILKRSFYK